MTFLPLASVTWKTAQATIEMQVLVRKTNKEPKTIQRDTKRKRKRDTTKNEERERKKSPRDIFTIHKPSAVR